MTRREHTIRDLEQIIEYMETGREAAALQLARKALAETKRQKRGRA